MSASQSIILELNKLNIELDMPPNKLKSGYGEGVCTVLYALCEMSLRNKFKYKKGVIKDDAGMDDGEEDDMDDHDLEGNADINDMQDRPADVSDGDDIDEDLEFGGAQAITKDADEPLL